MRIYLIIFAMWCSTVVAKDPTTITWKKTVVDAKFRSEGVTVADVNKDGKLDIIAGEYWYEAPDWKPHEMQKPGDYGDGLKGYSKIFACWADDFNGDGYPDVIVIDFPGVPCYWLENPKGKTTDSDGKPLHWKRHTICHSACNETPQYVDLLGNGKKVLIMGVQPKDKKVDNEGVMAYFSPDPKDPTVPWIQNVISDPAQPNAPGTNRYSHGLGVGDLNKDGKLDVITLNGWWEQPAKVDGKTPWIFHKGGVSEPSSDLFVMDVDGDGQNDILATSAHKFGIWWFKQRGDAKANKYEFQKQDLFPELVSETHAAHFLDIDGDGQKDLITGKRWWSHGRSEPGSAVNPKIYWFQITREKDGMAKFTPHVIDEGHGIGTQFWMGDINADGLIDVVVSNKKGVAVIVQVGK